MPSPRRRTGKIQGRIETGEPISALENSPNASHAVTRSQQLAEACKEVAKPYIEQISLETNLKQDSNSDDELLLNNVNVLLPIKYISKSYPHLFNELIQTFSKLDQFKQSVHFLNSNCNYIDVKVNKVPVRAILDTGAPGNIVLSKFVKKLGLQPDLIHEEIHGTAGPHSTKSTGAYSSLPIKFGSLITTAPAVVLENKIPTPLLELHF